MSSSSESEMSFDSDDSDINFILQFEKSAILQATKTTSSSRTSRSQMKLGRLDSLGENCTSGSELRFAKAKITSFSMYAVISRLKSYKFLLPEESPEFTCTVTEYPNVSVTVPSGSFLPIKDFAFTLKVQQAPRDYFEERGVFVSPILYISCPVEVELKEPALIRMPITLDQEQDESLNLPSSHIRVFYQSTGKESQEWVEITRELKPPPKLEIGVVSFQVNHFSNYWAAADRKEKKRRGQWRSFPSPNVPQHVGFLACLCKTRCHENYQLILCCFPNHLKVEVKNDVTSTYEVVSLGEGTSLHQMNKWDWASFHLPETYTPLKKESTYVRFLGHSSFQKSVNVQVENTCGSHLMKFVRHTTGRKKKETQLCNVSIVPVSKRQEPLRKPLTSEGEPGNIAMRPYLWSTVATIKQLLPLKEEIGTCWMDLGFALGLLEARVSNIMEDCNSNKERGYAVLMAWKEHHGNNATMGRLADVLDGIGRKDIVHRLLEQLDETENSSLQKENNRELREKSSSSNLKEECTPDCEENAEEDAVLKRPEEVIKKLNSDLENEKKLTNELQQRVEELQKHKEERESLQKNVKKQEKQIKILEKKVDELADNLFERIANNVQKKDEEIKELTSKKQQNEKQTEAAGMLVDECEKPHEQRKKEEERINKLTSDVKSDPKRALQLQQYIEESRILEDEYKRLKEEEIQDLRAELERAIGRNREERGIFEKKCNKLQNEVEEKEEIIKKLTSELKDERNRVQQLEQKIQESKIIEENLKRQLDPA